jgi:hypothetical protein
VSTSSSQNDSIKVSIQTKPAHFLPGIRTSTSEQSHRSKKNSNPTNNKDPSTGVPPRHSSAVISSKISPSSLIPPSPHVHPPVSHQRSEDDIDEYLSDDSLQKPTHRGHGGSHGPSPSIDNSTVISALTNDTTLQSFDPRADSDPNKIKKKKRKVWKMEPIPIRPYAQVPANGGSVR